MPSPFLNAAQVNGQVTKIEADLAVGLVNNTFVRLEHDLRGKLHNARRRVKSEEVAVRTSGHSLHRRNGSEGRIAREEGIVGQIEVRVVEDVERLRANRQVEPFRNLEVLEQVHVHVEVMRPAKLIAPLRWVSVLARLLKVSSKPAELRHGAAFPK